MAGKTQIKEEKADIVKKFGRGSMDTGSTEIQVALLTRRIEQLNEHFKDHPKDNHSRRGLLQLVGQRRRLIRYIRNRDEDRYAALIQSLNLRK